MLFDEGMVRFLLYPAVICTCKSFIHNLYHVQLLTFPLTGNHLLFTVNGPESPVLLKAGMNGRSLLERSGRQDC